MIGTTQLVSGPLVVVPNSQGNPYTSFANVYANESSNGFYWINDGVRTREYYFCLDGSESGNSNGAWARIDSTWASLGGAGGEPYTGYPVFDSSGNIGTACRNSGGYSGSHGGARVSSNTPFRMKRFIFSNLSLTSNGTWGGVTFPNTRVAFQDANYQTYAMTNPNSSHYPGWYPSTGWGDAVSAANLAVYIRQDGTVPTSTVTATTNQTMGIAGGIIYNISSSYHNTDLVWMIGQASYSSGQNRPINCKIWFQHD